MSQNKKSNETGFKVVHGKTDASSELKKKLEVLENEFSHFCSDLETRIKEMSYYKDQHLAQQASLRYTKCLDTFSKRINNLGKEMKAKIIEALLAKLSYGDFTSVMETICSILERTMTPANTQEDALRFIEKMAEDQKYRRDVDYIKIKGEYMRIHGITDQSRMTEKQIAQICRAYEDKLTGSITDTRVESSLEKERKSKEFMKVYEAGTKDLKQKFEENRLAADAKLEEMRNAEKKRKEELIKAEIERQQKEKQKLSAEINALQVEKRARGTSPRRAESPTRSKAAVANSTANRRESPLRQRETDFFANRTAKVLKI